MGIEGKSVHIMIPMYGGMCFANFVQSFTNLLFTFAKYGVKFTWAYSQNESLVTRARNRLADQYMKGHDETHALLIDSDIGFEPLDVMAMLEHDLDIMGAPCVKKGYRWDRIQSVIKSNGHDYTPEQLALTGGDFIFNFEPGQHKGEVQFDLGKPLEVWNIGTGIMMVRRNVFEGIKDHFPDRWYDSRGYDPADMPGPIHEYFRCGIHPVTRYYDSEDYWFCMDAKECGFKTWMLPWMKTSHLGAHVFRGDMLAVAKLAGRI